MLGPALLDIFAAHEQDAVRVLPCRPTISCSADIVPPARVDSMADREAAVTMGFSRPIEASHDRLADYLPRM